MNYGSHPGWIEVICGVMFAGKSEELIRRVRRAIIARRRVQVFKSHLDSRYTGLYSVSSHDGTELEASPVDSAAEIFRHSPHARGWSYALVRELARSATTPGNAEREEFLSLLEQAQSIAGLLAAR